MKRINKRRKMAMTGIAAFTFLIAIGIIAACLCNMM